MKVEGGDSPVDFARLQAQVEYLTRRRGFDQAMARVDAFLASAFGMDAGQATWLRAGILRDRGMAMAAMETFRAAEALLQDAGPALVLCQLDTAALANRLGQLHLAAAAAERCLKLSEAAELSPVLAARLYGLIGDTYYLKGNMIGAIDWQKQALRQLDDPAHCNMARTSRLAMMGLHWHALARTYLVLGDEARVRYAIDGERQSPHPDLQGLAAYDESQLAVHLGNLAQAERWLNEADRYVRDRTHQQLVLFGRIRLAQINADEATAHRFEVQLFAEHELVIYEVRMQLGQTLAREGVRS